MLIGDAGRLMVYMARDWHPRRLCQARKIFAYGVVQPPRWSEPPKQVTERVHRRQWFTRCGGEISVFENQDPAGLENGQHFQDTGCRLGQMNQQKSAIDQVKGSARKSSVAGIRLQKSCRDFESVSRPSHISCQTSAAFALGRSVYPAQDKDLS
jgi:hypothetical protein